MGYMTSIRLPLEDALLSAIDEQRGDVPRVRWIRRVLEERVAVQRGAIRVPEPKPSKPLPTKGGYPSSDRLVTDLEQPPRPKPAPPKGHEFKGQKVAPNRCEVCGVVRGRHH